MIIYQVHIKFYNLGLGVIDLTQWRPGGIKTPKLKKTLSK